MQEYKNHLITVRYDEKICAHAGKCVQSLPGVFDVKKKPWINVDGASVAEITKTIAMCPSKALSYELEKG